MCFSSPKEKSTTFKRFQKTSKFSTHNEAYRQPAIILPDISSMKKLNSEWKLLLTDEELEELRTCMLNAAESYQKVSDLIVEKHENGFRLGTFIKTPQSHMGGCMVSRGLNENYY